MLVLISLSGASLFADEVSFSTNTTKGCFGLLGCSPSSTTASTLSLSFAGSSMPLTTSTAGNLDITLGNLTLVNDANLLLPDAYVGIFTTQISFALPVTIQGGQTTSFSAPYIGSVSRLLGGGVGIDFNCLLCSNTQHFTFANSSYTGSFDLTIDHLNLLVGSHRNDPIDTELLIGHITNAQETPAVPEPASLVMVGSGLLTVAGGLRRRLKK